MPSLSTNFGLLDAEDSRYETSRVAVLPVPFERTTSYGKGTSGGPAAIVRASQAMELYDEELGTEPYRQGIATLPPFLPESYDMEEAMAELRVEARRHLESGKFLVTLGGEHSLTQAPVAATREVHGEIGVVQFDAHSDLREEFEGTPYSHASVMKRIVDSGLPTLAVGIRSLSAPESVVVREQGLPVIWGHQLDRAALLFPPLLARLPRKIYLTFDVDYFDPSLVPATGTPEPGGGLWYPTLGLLRTLFEEKEVVAMDCVELAPLGHQPASDFLAAKLIYKCLGYLAEAEGKKGSFVRR
ncbi:MAG TPA: agmatinase [Thermoanaerobaculia bacterium]|jgi:agmatinase|nr:agmatinase [Thermoanaerobaculia bacterium]